MTLSACGGGSAPAPAAPAIPAPPSPAPVTTLTGVVVDGYIRGATVFLDANNNGILDAGEASVTSDSTGRYSLALAATPVQLNGAHLRATGGTDMSTGQPFTHTMSAIVEDAANKPFVPVTPLSTVIDGIVTSSPGTSIAQARDALARVIGVSSVSVLDKDPLTQVGSEPSLLQKMVSLQKAMEVLASADRNGAEKTSDGAPMVRVSSAMGAEIIRLAAAMAPAQAGVPAVLPSVAAIVSGAVGTGAKFFASQTNVRASVASAWQTARLSRRGCSSTH